MCIQYVNRYSKVFTYCFTIIIITANFNIRTPWTVQFLNSVRSIHSLSFHLSSDIVPNLGLRLCSYMFDFIYMNPHLDLLIGLRDNIHITFYSNCMPLRP